MVRFVGTVAFLAAASSAAWAQERVSFSSLTGSGYEIRSVTFVAMESVNRLSSANPPNIDAIAVTLQKGNSVAVCYTGLSDWLNQSASALDNPAICARR